MFIICSLTKLFIVAGVMNYAPACPSTEHRFAWSPSSSSSCRSRRDRARQQLGWETERTALCKRSACKRRRSLHVTEQVDLT